MGPIIVKRYGFGQHIINHEGGAIGVPAIVENPDGEYVKYEAYSSTVISAGVLLDGLKALEKKYNQLDEYNDRQIEENVRLQERVLELEMKYIGVPATD